MDPHLQADKQTCLLLRKHKWHYKGHQQSSTTSYKEQRINYVPHTATGWKIQTFKLHSTAYYFVLVTVSLSAWRVRYILTKVKKFKNINCLHGTNENSWSQTRATQAPCGRHAVLSIALQRRVTVEVAYFSQLRHQTYNGRRRIASTPQAVTYTTH
jgi:hypothetical protein